MIFPKLVKTGKISKFRFLIGLIFLVIMIYWIYQKKNNDLSFTWIDYLLIILFAINGVIHVFGGAGYQLNNKK